MIKIHIVKHCSSKNMCIVSCELYATRSMQKLPLRLSPSGRKQKESDSSYATNTFIICICWLKLHNVLTFGWHDLKVPMEKMYLDLLHNVWDIECKYGFLECKYRAILHGSTDWTSVSARGQTTVKRGRINGEKTNYFLDLPNHSPVREILAMRYNINAVV